MKKVSHLRLFGGLFILVMGFNSCSDDDDNEVRPTGLIEVQDFQELSDNILTVQKITVGQDSWLAAVNIGEANTHNFIAQPVKVQKGTEFNIPLRFEENAITDTENGQQVVLKLYSDNPSNGKQGEWDTSDEPIKNNSVLVTKIITVFAFPALTFADLDTDDNGSLDKSEVLKMYLNLFYWESEYDREEFTSITYSLTDLNDNSSIDLEEWDEGYISFFGNWIENDFASFDTNSGGTIGFVEWKNAFARSDWFGTFDTNADDMIEKDEWDAGLFEIWDTNGTGIIEEEEFEIFSRFVLSW